MVDAVQEAATYALWALEQDWPTPRPLLACLRSVKSLLYSIDLKLRIRLVNKLVQIVYDEGYVDQVKQRALELFTHVILSDQGCTKYIVHFLLEFFQAHYEDIWVVEGVVNVLSRLGRFYPQLQDSVVLPTLAKITDPSFAQHVILALCRIAQSNRSILNSNVILSDHVKSATQVLANSRAQAVANPPALLFALQTAGKLLLARGSAHSLPSIETAVLRTAGELLDSADISSLHRTIPREQILALKLEALEALRALARSNPPKWIWRLWPTWRALLTSPSSSSNESVEFTTSVQSYVIKSLGTVAGFASVDSPAHQSVLVRFLPPDFKSPVNVPLLSPQNLLATVQRHRHPSLAFAALEAESFLSKRNPALFAQFSTALHERHLFPLPTTEAISLLNSDRPPLRCGQEVEEFGRLFPAWCLAHSARRDFLFINSQSTIPISEMPLAMSDAELVLPVPTVAITWLPRWEFVPGPRSGPRSSVRTIITATSSPTSPTSLVSCFAMLPVELMDHVLALVTASPESAKVFTARALTKLRTDLVAAQNPNRMVVQNDVELRGDLAKKVNAAWNGLGLEGKEVALSALYYPSFIGSSLCSLILLGLKHINAPAVVADTPPPAKKTRVKSKKRSIDELEEGEIVDTNGTTTTTSTTTNANTEAVDKQIAPPPPKRAKTAKSASKSKPKVEKQLVDKAQAEVQQAALSLALPALKEFIPPSSSPRQTAPANGPKPRTTRLLDGPVSVPPPRVQTSPPPQREPSPPAKPVLLAPAELPPELPTPIAPPHVVKPAAEAEPKKRDSKGQLYCQFWLLGKCRKGDACTYSHEGEAPKRAEICKFFKTGNCTRGDDCQFSHDLKSVACVNFLTSGACPYGGICKYSHDPEVIQNEKDVRAEQKRQEEEAARQRQLEAEREATLPFMQHLSTAAYMDPFTAPPSLAGVASYSTSEETLEKPLEALPLPFPSLARPVLATDVILSQPLASNPSVSPLAPQSLSLLLGYKLPNK